MQAGGILLKANVHTWLLMNSWSRLSLILPHNGPLCGAASLSALPCGSDRHRAAHVVTQPAVS